MYLNATTYPYNSPTAPGISISGNGRAGSGTGWFDILDVAFDNSGNLLRLAIDFKQYDPLQGTSPDAGVFGSLRFNDPTITLNTTGIAPVPVPSTLWLFGSSLIGFAGFVRKQKMPK